MKARSRGFVAGLVCLLALFALVPNLAQAGEPAAAPAVAPEAEALDVLFGEKPACPEAEQAGTRLEAPVDPLEGAIFLLPVNPSPCPVSCEENACMWACAGGPRGCVKGCCVCY